MSRDVSKKTILRVLKKARRLITDPEHWTQRAFARNVYGHVVAPTSYTAVCWCASGAIEAATGSNRVRASQASKAVNAALRRARTIQAATIISLNDVGSTVDVYSGNLKHKALRQHPQVLRVFDNAIAKLERDIERDAAS